MEDFLLQCDEITSFEENLVESDASIYNYSAIAHQSYIKCISVLGDMKEKVKVVPSSTNQKSSSSIAVPPCDTEIFEGDYISWPGFRDLFTAIYINNKRLSSVEKLYHLFQKTSGEAREINRHIPSSAEGFTITWDNLRNQYENKRISINYQIRILFNT